MRKPIAEVCRADLYTPRAELMQKYPLDTVEKVLRVRDIHQQLIADPTLSQRDIVENIIRAYGVSAQSAYSDLRIVKTLLPTLTESRRNFHRWRANEMFLEVWRKAREADDLPTMERVASSYAKYNRVDIDDETPTDFAPVQPFVATMDPRVLGLEPIPNVDDVVKAMIARYSKETPDIMDVEYEESDLEEDELFPAAPASSNHNEHEDGDDE